MISKEQWIEQDKPASIIENFKNDFELTNNITDFVISQSIEQWIDRNKLKISMTKFGMELNKYCKINKLENINTITKKIKGKCVRVRTGIKEILELEIEE